MKMPATMLTHVAMSRLQQKAGPTCFQGVHEAYPASHRGGLLLGATAARHCAEAEYRQGATWPVHHIVQPRGPATLPVSTGWYEGSIEAMVELGCRAQFALYPTAPADC